LCSKGLDKLKKKWYKQSVVSQNKTDSNVPPNL
jgi:hypothetical protein